MFKDIAIIGMSCRFPLANSIEEYWNILKNGVNTSSPPPRERLLLSNLENCVNANFLKCRVDEFDASFFGLSPNQANLTDPQARLLLEVSWEAFEDASINPEFLRGSQTGVFYGAWTQDYKEQLLLNRGPEPNSSQHDLGPYIGNGFGATAAKLSQFYGFKGPNIATESACSSSIVAVDLACQSLSRGDCSMALACGANIILQWNDFGFLAADGKCKSFDEAANGFGRGEGVAVLLLKRLSQALADGDQIHGIIKGCATAQEGLTKSFGSPTKESQTEAMKAALQMAKVCPSQVDYVEAHATGTTVGDPIEAASIVAAYTSPQKRESPLFIGSLKTNIGHTESCSGIAAIIKVVLAMKHELIPPHINLQKLNQKVNFTSIPGVIPKEPVSWKRNYNRPRLAGISSFGITGTNVHLIIEEPACSPLKKVMQKDKFPTQIITLSAKTEGALINTASLFQKHLKESQDTLEDMAFTLTTCRTHFKPFRRVLIGSTKEEIIEKLSSQTCFPQKSMGAFKSPAICFMFPGTATSADFQSIRFLYEICSSFRIHLDNCHSIAQQILGVPGLTLLLQKGGGGGGKHIITESTHWLLSILEFPYALLKTWESWGVKPNAVIGHCAGELVAAISAGVMDLEDAFRIVKEMWTQQDISEGKGITPRVLMAINVDSARVSLLIQEFNESSKSTGSIEITADNSKTQTIVSGPVEDVKRFRNLCTSNHLQCTYLAVPQNDSGLVAKLHTEQIDSTMRLCNTSHAWQVKHREPSITYFSSVTGTEIKEFGRDYWYHCFRNRIQFTPAVKAAEKMDKTYLYIEIGVGRLLTKMILETLEGKGSGTIGYSSGGGIWERILYNLGVLYVSGGFPIEWESFYGNTGGKKVSLPHYPFERKHFWYERNPTCLNSNWFEKLNPTCYPNHPLLGQFVKVTSGKLLFESEILLKNAPYLRDHMIGPRVVFPAAGFLEMMLSVGKLTLEPGINEKDDGAEYSYVVTNFVVHCALVFPAIEEDEKGIIVQTVVNLNSMEISIFSRLFNASNSNSNKKLHASATFSVENCNSQNFSNELTAALREIEVDKEMAPHFYKNLVDEEAGLNFGPSFQTLTNIRQGNEKTWAEIGLIPPQNNWGKFLLHPLSLDAMLQCHFLHGATIPLKGKLFVPVAIKKLVILPSNLTNQDAGCQFIQAKGAGQLIETVLLDATGNTLGQMCGANFVATTVHALIASSIGQDEDQGDGNMPSLYSTVWKNKGDFKGESFFSSKTDNLNQIRFESDAVTHEERQLQESLSRLSTFYVMNALYELGWNPEKLAVVDVSDLISELGIIPSLTRAFKHYLKFLLELGVFREGHENGVYVLQNFPSKQEVDTEIRQICQNLGSFKGLKVFETCGMEMAAVLRGKVTPQHLLFGARENGETLAQLFYQQVRTREANVATMRTMLSRILIVCQNPPLKRILRLLEVGAGTGSFTLIAMEVLKEANIEIEYYFTDVSSSFFVKDKFEASLANAMTFALFDIERDGLEQGIPPRYFDLIIAGDVLHATRNIKESLSNLQPHLRSGGRILISETNVPIKEVDISFGLLDGYWRFEDDLRPSHCAIPREKWPHLLEASGFDPRTIVEVPFCNAQKSMVTAMVAENFERHFDTINQKVWIIIYDGKIERLSEFLKLLNETERKTVPVSITQFSVSKSEMEKKLGQLLDKVEGVVYLVLKEFRTEVKINVEQEGIISPFIYLLQIILEKKQRIIPKILVVTSGVWDAGFNDEIRGLSPVAAPLWGVMRCVRLEIPGLQSKSIDLEPAIPSESWKQLFNELWFVDKESEILFRQGTRLVRRLEVETLSKNYEKSLNLSCFNSTGFFVECPRSKLISDLKLVPKKPSNENLLLPNQIEVAVRSAALNFRDVVTIMKPLANFNTWNQMGTDYAGEVIRVGSQVKRFKVGDCVYGFSPSESTISTQIKTIEGLAAQMPPTLTFSEMATLPTVFLTAWYCLVYVGKLNAGETILIHAASGGVGLAAIQIAKVLGAKVIGTAGNPKKRHYLGTFLGIKHVFNSRTLDYRKNVMDITNGEGVQMVLNCLTGPGFKEASLELVKEGGHFVEMSKMDVFTSEQVHEQRSDVKYTIVDLTTLKEETGCEIMWKLNELLAKGLIKPLPFTRFFVSNVSKAVSFLQNAKHIGKVVVELPIRNSETSGFEEKIFNERSTYLITGGRGSIGLAIAEWMIEQGGRFIVLAGRSPPNKHVLETIHRLEKGGARIMCEEMDISEFSQCARLIQKLKNNFQGFPPLRGIHHCAMVLSDKSILEQDWESFNSVFRPKIYGAKHLHELTLGIPLEFFVMHSSMASSLGNVGQANYGAANAYLDSLVEMRRGLGLQALTINWGLWDNGSPKTVAQAQPFSVVMGLNALGKFMRENVGSILAGRFDMSWYRKMFRASETTLLEKIPSAEHFSLHLAKRDQNGKRGDGNGKRLMADLKSLTTEKEKRERVEVFVSSVVKGILGFKEEDELDRNTNFQEMGMDSLRTVDFTNQLQSEVGEGVNIGFVDMDKFGTVEKMGSFLLSLMEDEGN